MIILAVVFCPFRVLYTSELAFTFLLSRQLAGSKALLLLQSFQGQSFCQHRFGFSFTSVSLLSSLVLS